MSHRSFLGHGHLLRSIIAIVVASLTMLGGAFHSSALASSGSTSIGTASLAQNVDWMSAATARNLDLGFSVLVPTYIPGPFGGAPAVSASGGYYSLYWQLGGGSPTFLEVSGTVGGSLPAGSPADLNNELFINANVQGYEAIHEVTDIYDSVWWIAGGVLYQVVGLNVSVDSLSLANSLVTLIPPAPEPEPEPEPTEEPAPEPEPTEEPAPDTGSEPDEGDTQTDEEETASDDESTEPEEADEEEALAEDEEEGPSNLGEILSAPASVASGGSATIQINGAEASDLLASDGFFVETDGTGIVDVQDGSIAWRAPAVEEETVVTIQLLVSQTGDSVDELQITVRPLSEEDLDEDSDGTQGAVSPVVGGDGTGGAQELTLPFVPDDAP